MLALAEDDVECSPGIYFNHKLLLGSFCEFGIAARAGHEVSEGRAHHADKLSRPEAIRRLLDMALANTSGMTSPPRKKTSAKASEMAGSTLDQLGDKSASPEQQAKRKRRLVKGPSEFREMRDDLAKRRR